MRENSDVRILLKYSFSSTLHLYDRLSRLGHLTTSEETIVGYARFYIDYIVPKSRYLLYQRVSESSEK